MSNIIFLATLVLSWETITSILKLRIRTRGIGDGSLDGYDFTVIQRDDQIYIELPNCPHEKCEHIVKKLLQMLKPDADIRVTSLGYVSTHCNYCLVPDAMLHKCHRCDGWYCNNHRLPEQHSCPGDRFGRTTQGIGGGEQHGQHENQGQQILVSRVPCG